MGSSILITKAKLGALCVAGAIAIAVVGVACWYGRGATAQTTNDADSAGDAGKQGGEGETTTLKPAITTSPGPPGSGDFLPGTQPWMNLHLPKYTVPVHYDLTLFPDFYGENSEFYGNVTIEIDVKQATQYLMVHIKYLDCKVMSVRSKKDPLKDYGVSEEWSYEPNQFWVVKTNTVIEESSTVLMSIMFNGSLSNGIVGFYKAFYANNTKSMATSKFEPVDARKAFPCFDEPNLKATYTTTLVHQADFTPLSNMPVQTTVMRPDGLTSTTFEKSVPMSTYLACFIVCKCSYKEKRLQKSGKPFRVYAVEGSEDQIDYSLQFGADVTDYFEDYFGLDYPLPKMDMIAIPDFVSGAMEHWGLITYRETNLLYKDGVSSPANKQRIAEVVAHELAHQWFGNIVTMDWWDDLWLNEGFATFMSYVGTEPFEPGMEVFSQFAPIEVFTVMPEDSVASSHPIIVPVNRPEEITAVFDSISYNKGASVIRMLQAFVGEEKFKQGLTEYMKRYRFGNTKTYQLWESIGENIDQWDVELIMDTWTKQSGFPLITISFNTTTDRITATQQLCKDPDETTEWPESPFQYKWEVPLHYISSAGNSSQSFTWLSHKQDSVEFDNPIDMSDDSAWIKFNQANSAYYKVNYPDATWRKMGEIMGANPNTIPVADRAGLVYDAISLPLYGFLSYDKALSFLTYMTNETHYVPWTSIHSGLNTLQGRVSNKTLWNEFVVGLVKKSYDSLAWKDGGTHLEQLLKGTVIRLACHHEYSDCLNTAKVKFTQWLGDPLNLVLDTNLRRDIYYYGMIDVSEAQWDQVWDLYSSEPVASAKTDMRRGLARAKDVQLINKYLSYAMDKLKIPDQDFFSVVSYLSANDVALPIVWEWAKTHYQTFKDRFGLDNRYFGRMVPGIASYFTTPERLQEVEDFFAAEPEAGSGARSREQAVETIKMAIAWNQKYADTVDDWLKNR